MVFLHNLVSSTYALDILAVPTYKKNNGRRLLFIWQFYDSHYFLDSNLLFEIGLNYQKTLT